MVLLGSRRVSHPALEVRNTSQITIVGAILEKRCFDAMVL